MTKSNLPYSQLVCVQSTKMLIFTRKQDIRLQQLGGPRQVAQLDMVVPVDNVQSADAVVGDPEGRLIFWTDKEKHTISRSFINGSDQQIIIATNLGTFQNSEIRANGKVHFS